MILSVLHHPKWPKQGHGQVHHHHHRWCFCQETWPMYKSLYIWWLCVNLNTAQRHSTQIYMLVLDETSYRFQRCIRLRQMSSANCETLSYKFCQPLKMTLVLSLTHLVSLVWPNFKNLLSTLNVESNKFYDIVSVFQLFNLTLAIEKEKKKIFGFVEHLSQTYSRTKCDSIYINNSNNFDHN